MIAQQYVRICSCGCGQPTTIATETRGSRGSEKGQPTRYCSGHRPRRWAEPRAVRNEETGCLEWQWARNRDGYGMVTISRKNYLAHRVAWEQSVGPIPDGLTLDHLCFVRHCIAVEHLEPVTQSENAKRSHAAKRAARTEVDEQ